MRETIVAVVSTCAYANYDNLEPEDTRNTHLHEMTAKPDMCTHRPFEINLVSDFLIP